MSASIEENAKMLASRKYATVLLKEEPQEDQMIFVAFNPELRGCMAQGSSDDEAIANLAEARYDYIMSLLADGLMVPDPSPISTTCKTTTTDVNKKTNYVFTKEVSGNPDEMTLQIRVLQPSRC